MNIFYLIWLLFPTLYFLIALWTFLDKLGKSVKKQNPQDFFKQGFFILFCVVISIALDNYLIAPKEDSLPEFLPLIMVRVLLLPVVFLILSLVVGGSTPPSLKKDNTRRSR